MTVDWKKLHRVAAYGLLHATLAGGVLLLALWAFLPPLERPVSYSQAFDPQSYRRISAEEAREVGLEFDRMGEHRSYRFDPWTQFGERPYSSRLLNVGPDGLRRTPEPAPGREDAAPLLVWVFGGSTVFGWGMPDGQTIPAHLQELLQAALPERRVRVVNHGHSFHYSSQEVADFLRRLRAEPAPHVAVFLDGLNDGRYLTRGFDVPYFTPFLAQSWERERARQWDASGDRPWVTIERGFPLWRLLERLRPPARPGPEAPAAEVAGEERLAFALARFSANHRAMLALGAAFGVDVYHVLQPTRLQDLSGRERGRGLQARFLAGLQEAGLERLDSAIDALVGLERAYVDWGHYSDQGCHEVARAVADLVLARRGALAPPR